jgi:hypothetical protein
MQVRIISTFVLSSWELPDNVAIRIFVFLSTKTKYACETIVFTAFGLK